MSKETPRDPSVPPEQYEQFIAYRQSEMGILYQALEKATDPQRRAGLTRTLPSQCIDVALALYSLGAAVADCRRWLGQAVDERIRFAELSDYRFEEYGTANEDLRTFSGACLLGRQQEVVKMHRRCQFQTNPVPGIRDMMEHFCAVLVGERPDRAIDERSLKKVAPDWLTLPPLFDAVAAREQDRFVAALEDYLSTSWEKYAKGMKRALKLAEPRYFGTWNLLSAALCKLMGGVPELSKKVRGYVPTELIEGS